MCNIVSMVVKFSNKCTSLHQILHCFNIKRLLWHKIANLNEFYLLHRVSTSPEIELGKNDIPAIFIHSTHILHRIYLIGIHLPIRMPFAFSSTETSCLSFSLPPQHFLLLRGSPRGGNLPNLGPPDIGGFGPESSSLPSGVCINEVRVSKRDKIGYQKLSPPPQ